MFRHRGKRRTLQHNIKLASLLSFVAGCVNVIGFFSIQRLTTNVTGHFAFFAHEVVKQNYSEAGIYLLYIFSFFFGAFVSSFLVEIVVRKKMRFINVIPVSLEIIILVAVAVVSPIHLINDTNLIACSLLFAMGLQNALVTSISNSVVRTTHLTGLFTDLGIELSQLFFYKKTEEVIKLRSSVTLHLVIIIFFFSGCVIGGYSYFVFGMSSLFLPAICLMIGLVYDNVKFRIVSFRRRYLN
jgi:uncharacterized membrane protein YoaK (UPF0700 family)